MEIYRRGTNGDVLVVSADGGLTHRNADQFEEDITKLIEEGASKVLIDCTALTYVSSMGIGALLNTHRKMAKRGGDVRLANVAGRVVQMLSLAGIDKFFHVYPDVETALEEFERDG